MNQLFSLKDFSFGFDTTNYFFKDISFEILKPGITFVIGKNGSGKSTFFRILQAITHKGEMLSGVLQINNQRYDLANAADRAKLHERCMILHQSFDTMLAPSFTGFENLTFAQFDKNPGLQFAHMHHHISQVAQEFNIPFEKQVALLSGGQRQMLALLMVAQNDIDVLLLDEPTSALDNKNSHFLMQGVAQLALKKNIKVLCISHDQEMIDMYAQSRIEIVQNDSDERIFKVT